MATIIDDFKRKGSGKSKYPWEEWTDGKCRCFTNPEDFSLKAEGFRSMMHTRAKIKKMKVRCSVVSPTEVHAQFYKEEP